MIIKMKHRIKYDEEDLFNYHHEWTKNKIWMLMVEKGIVHKDKLITFKFYNGKEIRVYSNESILN